MFLLIIEKKEESFVELFLKVIKLEVSFSERKIGDFYNIDLFLRFFEFF